MTKIQSLRARAVLVPMTRSLQTSTGSITKVPLVLIDITTSSGAIGRSYLFTITPLALKAQVALLDDMASLIVGQPLVPFEIEQMLAKRFTLLGATGLVGMAISGIDAAVWDVLAIEAGQPLAMVEAMKMENILRAERKAVVKRVAVKPGASLAVDELIMEFM